MVAHHKLPELVLSRNSARLLLTRNAGERELLRKKSFLIDKAKSEEEKGFERGKKQLLRHQSTLSQIQITPLYTQRDTFLQSFTPPPYIKFSAARKKLWRSEVKTDKWEVQSDTLLYTRQRRNVGIVFPNNKPMRTVQHTAAVQEQAWTRNSTSLDRTLPPISPPRKTNSQEKWQTEEKRRSKK